MNYLRKVLDKTKPMLKKLVVLGCIGIVSYMAVQYSSEKLAYAINAQANQYNTNYVTDYQKLNQ